MPTDQYSLVVFPLPARSSPHAIPHLALRSQVQQVGVRRLGQATLSCMRSGIGCGGLEHAAQQAQGARRGKGNEIRGGRERGRGRGREREREGERKRERQLYLPIRVFVPSVSVSLHACICASFSVSGNSNAYT